MKKAFYILFIFILFFIAAPSTRGDGASLYFSPTAGTFFVGSTFDVSIFVNTGGNSINTVKVDLKFDPKKLQIASPTAGRSFISVWISQPTYSNIEGTVSFQGGAPSPGINTSAGLVSTITFRAIAPGETIISILDSSQILLNDGEGTDVLSSLGRAVYKVVIPPPAGPGVSSYTHPDQNKWYKNNSPNFSWEKEEGAIDFSYSIDNNFYGTPDNISEGDHTTVSYADLEDGIWYFHIKAKKGKSWGGVSHYLVQIDTTPPATFSLVFEPALKSPVLISKEPIVSFITTDALSGLDHFELKTIDLRKTLEKKGTGFFVEVSSPYKLPLLNSGEYEIIVRAYDRAMNWLDASKRIDVIPTEKAFYITKRGINIWTIFLVWWKVILILIFFILLILIIIFYRQKIYSRLHQRKKILKEVKEKIKKSGEEIKRKLNGT